MIIKQATGPYFKWFCYEHEQEESFLLRYLKRTEINECTDLEIAQLMFKDWRGIYDQKSNPVPCTAEFIAEFMEVLEGRERYLWALRQALNLNNFVDLEDLAKNLPRPSNGGLISQPLMPAIAQNAKETEKRAKPAQLAQ